MLHRVSERLARLESNQAEAAKFADAEAVRAQQTEALVTSLLAFKETQAALSAQFNGAFAAFHALLTEAGMPLPHHWHQLESHLPKLRQSNPRCHHMAAAHPIASDPTTASASRQSQQQCAVPILSLPAHEHDVSGKGSSLQQMPERQGQAGSDLGAQELSEEESANGSGKGEGQAADLAENDTKLGQVASVLTYLHSSSSSAASISASAASSSSSAAAASSSCICSACYLGSKALLCTYSLFHSVSRCDHVKHDRTNIHTLLAKTIRLHVQLFCSVLQDETIADPACMLSQNQPYSAHENSRCMRVWPCDEALWLNTFLHNLVAK